MKINKKWRRKREQRIYSFKHFNEKKAARIIVNAENGGHGCLFSLQFPRTVNAYFGARKNTPTLDNFLVCLDAILKEYNCKYRLVHNSKSIKSISEDA